ncbi:MAG: FtsX-like permease family protein [Marinosulfonomonas sp.]
MTRAVLTALLSHWRRNPIQLFAFLAGLALATALWCGVQAINAEARASYDAAASTLGEGQYDQLLPKDGRGIPLELYVKLRRSGWLVSPVIDERRDGVRLVGIDPLTAPAGIGALQDLNSGPALGLMDQGTLLGTAETAQALAGVASVSVDANMAPGVAIGDISAVQSLLGRNNFNRLILLPVQPIDQPDLAVVAPELHLQAAQQGADLGQLTDSFHLNLAAFGMLSFAVGLFIVHSTIGLAFEQRRGMIRTLRSLGVPLRLVVTLITVEMLTLALIGAGLGVVFGYMVAAVLLPDVAATLRGLYGADISGTLQLRTQWWLSGLLIAMLGAGAALVGRIWQIAHMPLLASGRPRAWAIASKARFRWQVVSAILLLGVALLLGLFATGIIAGFALLGCMLIGAALALPVLAERIMSALQGLRSAPIWDWFWADTRQQLPGLSLALMALLLAVSANIGVSTMVSSFRQTFVSFLDQRLAPELFVQLDTADQSTKVASYLDANVKEVLPLMSTKTQIEGWPVQLFGVRVGPTYRDNWVFLEDTPDAWDRVAGSTAVIVNEQLARRAGLWVGEMVRVAPELSLPVAAVVGDYGNPLGQVVLSEQLFAQLYPDLRPQQFGLRSTEPAQLRRALTTDLGLPETAVVDQAAIKALSLQVFERTFSVTAALNVLTLGVAGFAMLMSLLTLADQRLPQLAPIWALGMTRRALGRLELLRAVALALLVFACAVPLGLALAWVLLSVINVEAFGWQLPIYFFPVEYLKLGAYSMLAAAVAAAWPAFRLMRMPPARLLKVFANER